MVQQWVCAVLVRAVSWYLVYVAQASEWGSSESAMAALEGATCSCEQLPSIEGRGASLPLTDGETP